VQSRAKINGLEFAVKRSTVKVTSLYGGYARAFIIASWLIGLSIVTECASDDQRLGSLHNAVFVTNLYRIKKLTKTEVSGNCFHELRYAAKRVTRQR